MEGILLTVAYDGTGYRGFQFQASSPSVQGAIEECLSIVQKRFTRVKGASRTDAGVHARGQRVFFTSPMEIPDQGYLRGLNALLPPDVAVVGVKRVAPSFNPRRTVGKLYEYTVRNSTIPDPLASRYQWEVYRPLDLSAMEQAAQYILGTHDFTSFQAADCERENAVRTVTRVEFLPHGEVVRIRVAGNAFLKYMVRIMVGTLIEVGRGRFTPEKVRDIIAARDRRLAGPTAPARGLCLVRVVYEGEQKEELYPNFEECP